MPPPLFVLPPGVLELEHPAASASPIANRHIANALLRAARFISVPLFGEFIPGGSRSRLRPRHRSPDFKFEVQHFRF
jgi:hypothetical protein